MHEFFLFVFSCYPDFLGIQEKYFSKILMIENEILISKHCNFTNYIAATVYIVSELIRSKLNTQVSFLKYDLFHHNMHSIS